MEKIGYIIQYNDSNEKGILVYGYNIYKNNPQNKPLSFSKYDCVSAVKEGQLVYFNLDDNKATKIERASLSNFKRNMISEIAKSYDSDRWDYCRYTTNISYRKEDVLEKSDHDNSQNDNPANPTIENGEKEDEILSDDILDEIDLSFFWEDYERDKWEEKSVEIIDILDIDKWFDEVTVKGELSYGTTAEEVLDLFNLFVKKRRDSYKKYAREGFNTHNTINLPLGMMDDSISPCWKLLLASLSKDDIRTICEQEPLLQPALPSEFCIENLDVLSIDYGFPDAAICEAYYKYRIGIIKLTTEYRFMSDKIYTANHCTAKHKEAEGVYPCQMGKDILQSLTDLLDNQFRTVVLSDIERQLTLLGANKIYVEQRISSLLKEGDFGYLKILGQFVDAYIYCILYNDNCFDKILHNYYDQIRLVLFVYDNLVEEDKAYLDSAIRNKYKECVMGIAKEKYYDKKVYRLCSLINNHPQYLTLEDFETIKETVNSEFAELDDLELLDDAANCDLISKDQHLNRYKEITKDYDIDILLGILKDDFHHKTMPASTQAFLIKQVFDKYNYKTLNSYHYIKVDYDTISNLGDLIGWFNKECSYGYLNAKVFGDILKEITEGLSKEDRWQLFEKELISSPGMDNIREYLDDAYKQIIFENEHFRKDCFQDVMCTDLLSTNDNKLKFMIAEHLDPKHQKELQRNCQGVVKLYLWIKNPDEDFDWNLISLFFAELPTEQQIKLFRYIFYLIAKQKTKVSIDELYTLFVESEKKACQSVSGIIYLLKEQLTPTGGGIKGEVLDEIIGKGVKNIRDFLLAKTFFYPCNGHLALTQMKQDRDYHTYNGYVDKIIVKEKECYSICFYDIPHDVCDREVDWLDNVVIQIAKAVLETNIKTEIIDGCYVVDNSEELALKQFLMAFDIDDRCCLLDSKQALIKKGYLPPNNSYQPLYTNYIRPYDDNGFDVCRCTNFVDVDSIKGIPFYWCNKKPCVRRCHYILPLSEWEKYKLSDFIYILLGRKSANISKVWIMTSDISQFFNAYIESKCTKNESKEPSAKEQLVAQSLQIKKSDEIGVLTEKMSVVQDIYDYEEEYDDDYDDDNYNDSNYFEENETTYERYNGSYAQDEMGYSDDDIDTIFDGDPSAYWNID